MKVLHDGQILNFIGKNDRLAYFVKGQGVRDTYIAHPKCFKRGADEDENSARLAVRVGSILTMR